MAKILVLDDQADICLSIKMRLMDDGHAVNTLQSCAEAIDFAHLFQPDLLIADWNLQCEYDGLEVIEACRAANQDIKEILISGHLGDSLRHRAREENVQWVLAKPFSLNELANLVEKVMNFDPIIPFSRN